MEKQRYSRLAEIQQKYNTISNLIDKRRRMLDESSSWNITRDDPDVEAAAKVHARRLIEKIIPDSINILEQRRLDLLAQREVYIQDHESELISKAEQFENDIAREEKIINQLKRDLLRGYTTQADVDRRLAKLQALKSLIETDIDLQVGFDLLKQKRQSALEEKAVEETTPEATTVAEHQIPIQESKIFTLLPPLLQNLRPITSHVEHIHPEPTDLIKHQLRIIKESEEEPTDTQEQLLEDIAFINNLSTDNNYQRVLTPEELHHVVCDIRKNIISSPNGRIREISLDFQRRIIEFAEQYNGYSGKVDKKDIQKAKNELQVDGHSPLITRRIDDFAETASMFLRGKIMNPNPEQNFRIKVDKVDWTIEPLYQAALDLACYDVYRNRYITPEQRNLESWHFNSNLINNWHTEVRDLLRRLMQDTRVAPLVEKLEETITSMRQKIPSERTDRYSLNLLISQQLKIGHLINDINNKLVFLQQKEAASANLPVEKQKIEGFSADNIPSILHRLVPITSIHEHKYNPDTTVRIQAQKANAIPPDKRTPEQKQLLEDISILSQFTNSESYQDVFNPDELHNLVEKLQLLSGKNRPEFNGVEDMIIGILEEKARVTQKGIISDSLAGIIERADRNAPNRRGMQWDTLCSFASEASAFIRQRNMYSSEIMKYFFSLQDPEPRKYPNLTPVYQLVADTHVLDVIGQRSLRARKDHEEAFIRNCGIINDWYDEVSPTLDSLLNYNNEQIKRLVYQLKTMIETMNIRLNGEQKSGINKSYKIDTIAVIRLQRKIGHTIEQLKATLSQPEPVEELIIPLQ
ncbi:MAG: hypothetical protein QXD41_03175 [Nitrososphaeria archaeon]